MKKKKKEKMRVRVKNKNGSTANGMRGMSSVREITK